MDTPQYEAELSSFRAIVEKGEGVDFACYDTFSCFYSRIFADRFVSEFPSGKITIRIFR
ncbi:MAG: hypothetical protein QG650_704 [Patescibacteria group bacterium]|nr:hypothetical protein [Patescibacteria group bacterium]